ncbi:MAG TPA: hypothetical protein VKB86_09940, partial [Pyrinomonadaceae bacterium]|nr:hypothetical protein [Pyrinomonadaceae bacterium]
MKLRCLLLTIAVIFFSVGNLSAQTPEAPAPYEVGEKKHTITPEDVLSLRELYDVKLSPDGKQIAFVVNEPNDPKRPREPRASNIWVVPTNGRELPRPLIPALKNADSPRWSPDGRWITFFEFPPTKESNNWLSLAPAQGGEIRQLLKDYRGSILMSEWAADSKSLLAQSVEGTREVISRVDIDTGAFHKITDVIQSQ